MLSTYAIEGMRSFYLSLYAHALGEDEALARFAAALRERFTAPVIVRPPFMLGTFRPQRAVPGK